MRVRLLGPPQVVGTDDVPPLRGFQVWAVLARVLLTERQLTRRELAAEIFPETADPLGALRWCLAAIRRSLGAPDMLTGDPVSRDLPSHVSADVLDLLAGRLDPEEAGDLLQGVEPRAGVDFDLWLLVQRQRVASAIDSLLRREVMAAAAAEDAERALTMARIAAGRQPLDEGAQILFVAALRQAGHHEAAEMAVEAVEERFARELGVSPTSALRSAARPRVASTPPGVPARSRALSLLEAGEAALAAGAVEAGLESLRHATQTSEDAGDASVSARCLRALGVALIHAVRSHDDEGALLLTRAAALAQEAGDAPTAASAYRELAYVDALAGRRPAAEQQLLKAEAMAGPDRDALAAVRAVRAFNLTDWGRHEAALEEWEVALDLARATGNSRRLAWTLGLGGWGQLRAGREQAARQWAHEALDVVAGAGWISFRPWPVSVLAEAELRTLQAPTPDLHQAFALSCQLSDPCWEGGTARVLAIRELREGRPAEAMSWIQEAGRRVRRETDVYVAMQAAILATDIEVSSHLGRDEQREASARALLALAARAHMDDHLEHATSVMQTV